MLKKLFFILIILLFITLNGFSQADEIFTLNVNPTVNIPLGTSTDRYTIGGGGAIKADYTLPFMPIFFGRAGIDYDLIPIKNTENILNTFSFGVGAGLRVPIIPNLNIAASGEGGYFIGIFNENFTGSFFYKVSGEISYRIIPSLSLGLGVSYKNFIAADTPFFEGLSVGIASSFHLGAAGTAGRTSKIEIQEIQLYSVFPVFAKYYDTNEIGKVKIKNGESGVIKNVKVHFFVKQYMDTPKECIMIPEMKKWKSHSMLFLRIIFSI